MRRLTSVAVALSLTACVAAYPTPPMPTGLRPAATADAAAWAATTAPEAHLQLQFHWKFNDVAGDGSRTAGRGAVHMAGPDSLKLDYRGPLGFGAGAAAVLGDSALWAQPEDQVQKLVPNYPLLWAMVGVARPPRGGWTVSEHHDARTTAWRYTRGTDTVDYVWTANGTTHLLEAYVRDGGKPIGRVVTVFDATGSPARARLDVLTTPARLEITFTKVSHPAAFDPEAWRAPHDQ